MKNAVCKLVVVSLMFFLGACGTDARDSEKTKIEFDQSLEESTINDLEEETNKKEVESSFVSSTDFEEQIFEEEYEELENVLYQTCIDEWENLSEEYKYQTEELLDEYSQEDLEACKGYEMNMVLEVLGVKEWIQPESAYGEEDKECDKALGRYSISCLEEYTKDVHEISIEYFYGRANPKFQRPRYFIFTIVYIDKNEANGCCRIYAMEKNDVGVMTHTTAIYKNFTNTFDIDAIKQDIIENMKDTTYVLEHNGHILYEWYAEDKVYFIYSIDTDVSYSVDDYFMITLSHIGDQYEIEDIKYLRN